MVEGIADPFPVTSGLVRFRVDLADVAPERVRPEGIHATVCRWLDAVDDHHLPRKPFSVTPVFREGDGRVAFEVGVFSAGAAERMWERSRRGPVRFGPLSVPADRRRVSVVEARSWKDLCSAPPARSWTFEFLTPTTFRSGSLYQPFPLPGSVFGHLRKIWNVFGPGVAEVDFGSVGLAVAAMEGRVESIVLRGRSAAGFVGWVMFQAPSAGDDAARMLSAFAQLAAFSGVGARTTFGLGVTRLR